MKIKTLAIVIVSTMSFNAASVFAADAATPVTVNGGTIHFKGEVVNAACAVDAGSLDQTIQLGQVRTAKLATAGSTSSPVGFNIKLNDCDASVSQNASVAFTGTAVSSTNPNVLALQGSTSGGATNVGVQILDSTGAALSLNGSGFSAKTTISNGTNSIPLQARYYATGAATAGSANADATFKVQYQ